MFKIKSITRHIAYVFETMKYVFLLPISKLLCSGRNIYLISERGTDARDNGYHMFKYYRTKHPEKEVYYVITKDSADVAKLKEYGNIVWYRSLRHYLYFIASNYKISTHIMGCSPNIDYYASFFKKLHLHGRFVFLQHGITKDDIPQLYREKTNLDMFVCGAKPEYDYIIDRFHYVNGEAKYTGFARFDNLHDFKTKQQILIMPTWRSFLKGLSFDEIKNSEYIKRWNELLLSHELNDIVRKYDVEIIFYPHYELQPFISLFQTENPSIKCADFASYDVQTLLKESLMLITDYSSVYFDFAYMEKPCIYYQFDKEEFFNSHYHHGYFDYETMGFGPVLTDFSSLIFEIEKNAQNGFIIDDQYLQRINGFFSLHDKNNCLRIFEEIERLSVSN